MAVHFQKWRAYGNRNARKDVLSGPVENRSPGRLRAARVYTMPTPKTIEVRLHGAQSKQARWALRLQPKTLSASSPGPAGHL